MKGVLVLLVLTGGVFAGEALCQSPQPRDDFQSWNDLQLTVPIDKNFRKTVGSAET